MHFSPINFANIAEIKKKIHGICRKLRRILPEKNPESFTRASKKKIQILERNDNILQGSNGTVKLG